ncbi:MAG: (d)CMP kinase, partial [Dehalococcoidia bacterium]
LLTNDGNLTNRLTHPGHGVEKEYLVAVDSPLTPAELQRAVRGIEDSGERLRWQSARTVIPPDGGEAELPSAGGWLLVVLRQGRKREIRRILGALGRNVVLLRRIRIGPLALGALGSGAFRELAEGEVRALYDASSKRRTKRGKPEPEKRPAESGLRQGTPPRTAAGQRRRLPWNVAIDGPAASGKTAVGTALSRTLGYDVLDTGAMYRAFALAAMSQGVPAEDSACARLGESLQFEVVTGNETRILIDGEDVTPRLREPEVEDSVSSYSALPAVRRLMVESQREAARRSRTVVLGRDIGTVVLPEAPVKIYLDASEPARAKRRSLQTGDGKTKSSRRNIAHRDTVDSTRAASPLRPAVDAVRIDTTNLSLAEVVERVTEVVRCASE